MYKFGHNVYIIVKIGSHRDERNKTIKSDDAANLYFWLERYLYTVNENSRYGRIPFKFNITYTYKQTCSSTLRRVLKDRTVISA